MDTFFLKFRKYLEYSVYIFFIFVYPFLFVRYGLNFTDGPFEYIGYTGHRYEFFNVAFLSVLIGSWCNYIFGDSIISFRIFATTLSIISIAIPIFFLTQKDNNIRTKLRYVALVVVFYTTSTNYELGYDTTSLFFLSLMATAFLAYLKNGGYWSIVLAGTLTALVVSARLPSVVIIFPVLSVLGLQIYNKKLSTREGIILSGCYLIAFSVIFFILRKLFITPSTTPPLLGDSHSLYNILKTYVRDGNIIFEMMAVLSLLTLVYDKLKSLLISATQIRIILFAIIVIYFRYHVTSIIHLSLFYSAAILWVLLILLYDSYHKNNKDDMAVYWFCIMLGFVPVLGSDTGLFKLIWGYMLVTPILLYKFRHIIFARDDLVNVRLLAVFLIGVSIFDKAGIGGTYEDKTIKQLTVEVAHNKLSGIKTSSERKDQIESVISNVDKLRASDPNANFMFYGSKAYLFTYLTNSDFPYPTPFYMTYQNKEDELRLSNYLSKSSTRPYVFLIFDYPDSPADMNGYLIADCLKKYGYKLTYNGLNYQIYAVETNSNAYSEGKT